MKPFSCKVGFHDWVFMGRRTIVEPKRGPHDERTTEQRTHAEDYEACSQCGKDRRYQCNCAVTY